MIDTLPLDLFGDDDNDATPEETTACPWCEAIVTVGTETCPACGARIPPAPPPPPPTDDTICQWCGTTITPDADLCPTCGWDARGDNQIDLPGLTTPLSETQVRTLYGGDPEDDTTPETIELVTGLINLILPRD